MPHDEILLARQPILDRDLRLRGYELLARDPGGQFPNSQPGHVTTSQVLLQALTEFGLESVVGELPAFFNLTREFLVGEIPLPLPPQRVVLEVLESIEPDAEVLRGVRSLKARGFRIALDDFAAMRPQYHELLGLMDVVKVDCLGLETAAVERLVEDLRPYGVRLLAEKVERPEEFRAYEQMGFELFQGYFFARPDMIKGRSHPADRANLLQLMAELQKPSATPEDLENIITRDPALSLKLVRFLNSAQFGLSRRIESLREVVVYLGVETVRNIASLLLIARIDGKPRQLMVTAMMRARMCEELARGRRDMLPQRSFMVGLFSTLDALVDQELDRAVQALPLRDDMRAALIQHSGPLGEQLEQVLAFERGEFGSLPASGASAQQLQQAFLKAVGWVATMEKDLAVVG